MKKWILCLLILTMSSGAFSLKVSEKEIKGSKKVRFINYRGVNKKRDSVYGVNFIGVRLSKIKRSNRRFSYMNKYSIIHAVSKKQKNKYSADIFSIERRAKVDHIKNVRRIMASYLSNKYKYSYQDAFLLATFATYYNAVHRGNINFFKKKYKSVVMRFLNKNNAGIDLHYKKWAGKSRLLIPLEEGNEKKLSTTEVTDKKVIDDLRMRKNKGLPERKKMVTFKEQEVKKKEKKVEKIQKDIKKSTQQIEGKKKEVTKKKEEIKKKEEEIKQISDPKKKKEEEKKLEKKKEEIKKEIKTIKKEEKKIEEKKKEIVETKEKIEKKKEEIKEEKKVIKKDEKELDIKKNPAKYQKKLEELEKKVEKQKKTIEEKEKKISSIQEKNIYKDKFYYLKRKNYTTQGHYDNEMLVIDADTRKIVTKSPLKTISGQKFDIFGAGVVVIAREDKRSKVHHLVMLNKDDLSLISMSKENIFWRSMVEIRDNSVYAIVMENNQFFLARFNDKLKMIAKSKNALYADTSITFYKNFIYLNNAQKNIIVLKKDDLSFVEKIKP